jgi:hypothetical protein
LPGPSLRLVGSCGAPADDANVPNLCRLKGDAGDTLLVDALTLIRAQEPQHRAADVASRIGEFARHYANGTRRTRFARIDDVSCEAATKAVDDMLDVVRDGWQPEFAEFVERCAGPEGASLPPILRHWAKTFCGFLDAEYDRAL